LRLRATQAAGGEWLIGFGAVAGDETLSFKGDLREAAANLFSALHHAEASSAEHIAVAPIPEEGIGRAINDRLRRAAAPRGSS
jgi:L-threonylcarbamoyladenylate synthase